MSSLAELQQLFWRSVRTDPAPPQVDDAFVTRGRLSGRARLAVYRTAYWVRQTGALQEVFPSVAKLLGAGPFARHASHYVAQHPSTHWALELLGRDFPQWLSREVSEDVGRLAAVDWARLNAVLAPNEAPLVVEPAWVLDMTMHLAAHVSACPVDAAVLRQSGSAVAWQAATHLAVWRADLRSSPESEQSFAVMERLVDAREAAAMAEARVGVGFPRWCEVVVDEGLHDEASATRALALLQQWLVRGWLVSKRKLK